MSELRLITMSDVKTQTVQWLWHPYIPYGKITIIQGDPGEGKTHLVLAITAKLTKGEALPCFEAMSPVSVIYQTAEDGLADTIKPRLEVVEADCDRVLVIDESSGRQYAHFVQSFYRYDDLTPEQAMEIGQKFMARYERFKDFQVCAAVHTNGPQLHIHYVVNSVSHVDGNKWQSSREDLKRMRSLNDELCREYGLQVYEKQRGGHRSYGEYIAKDSWKQYLAEDIIQCIRDSNNLADFKLLLENRGVECDIGRKSILFTVQSGTYGLAEERNRKRKTA